jgi:arylsulfatase A-like enzyme
MNVLFIAVDDLRAQAGVYNKSGTITPSIDKFAASALLFENAHAQIAHCSPSRNSLMSGRTNDRIKVWNFIDDFRAADVGGDRIESLPEYFKRRGYHTWGSGKVFHPNLPPSNDQGRSWTDPCVARPHRTCTTARSP